MSGGLTETGVYLNLTECRFLVQDPEFDSFPIAF